ncbi:TPA: hypothetical protein N0F65_010228 [Lagenidium giganteum]|uniref:Major facilitator superfamily (MFS) profile domain-containing protein n=1 Tax=Lagenidium giganteum TaxID=4803 RepID=A0AAV2Z0A3_9STRA|nr:TPA: hypothetical protein N0F65_010228 [Lagenidium giganteum]
MATTPQATITAPVDNLDAVQRITRRIDSIGERSDGIFLGLSWYYLRLICMTGIGWAMDSMETFVFIYCGGLIAKDIEMSVNQASFLGGAVFVGSFFGSFMFGSFADKYGRRPMFMVTLLIFLVGLGLCGASWNITSLTCFRIMSGIGLGGELPVASTLVQELAPKKTRGKIIVLLESFWSIGCMVAVWLAFGVAPHIGWRNTFYLCLIPVVYSAVIRFAIPESPKWLASVGRYDEAVAVVESMERAHGLTPLTEAECVDVEEVKTMSTFQIPEGHLSRIALLFRKPFSVRTSVLWTLWFGISLSYYAIFIYMPGLISANGGYNLNKNWRTMLIITLFQLPGYFSASILVELLGRRMTLVIYLMASFASAIAMGYVEPTQGPIMASGSSLSFFLLGAWGCVYAYTPENYPTSIRGIGSAYPAGFSRIGAFIGPYLVPHMQASWKMSLTSILWVFGGVLIFISIVVLVFGFEPRGKNIEDVDSYTKVATTDEDEKYVDVQTPGKRNAV